MKLGFTASQLPLSRFIRRVTGEPVSHCVILAAGYVIHSNFRGVRADPVGEFNAEIVYTVDLPGNYEGLLALFAESRWAPYDFGALLYLAIRCLCPRLPKKNLWQCSGMYLCTEWVTRYLSGEEDSMITPYKLYLRLSSPVPA